MCPMPRCLHGCEVNNCLAAFFLKSWLELMRSRLDWKQVVCTCVSRKVFLSSLELENIWGPISDLGDHWVLFLWLRVHLMWYHVTLFQGWLQAGGIWHFSLKWCELAALPNLGVFFLPPNASTSSVPYVLGAIHGCLWQFVLREHQVGWFKSHFFYIQTKESQELHRPSQSFGFGFGFRRFQIHPNPSQSMKEASNRTNKKIPIHPWTKQSTIQSTNKFNQTIKQPTVQPTNLIHQLIHQSNRTEAGSWPECLWGSGQRLSTYLKTAMGWMSCMILFR